MAPVSSHLCASDGRMLRGDSDFTSLGLPDIVGPQSTSADYLI
ncbi:rCG63108 [Rattus norvegicus]|uniref:RCG63108 n=1 Tax=Rattus norvegicus TaxID=10116 RepID=A6K6H8_RAT|nr:rCG63108 [Rattus norvegicus]